MSNKELTQAEEIEIIQRIKETEDINVLINMVESFAQHKENLEKSIENKKLLIKQEQAAMKELEKRNKDIEDALKQQIADKMSFRKVIKIGKNGTTTENEYGEHNLPDGWFAVELPKEETIRVKQQLDFDKIYIEYPQYNTIQDQNKIIEDHKNGYNFPKKELVEKVPASGIKIAIRWAKIPKVKGIE